MKLIGIIFGILLILLTTNASAQIDRNIQYISSIEIPIESIPFVAKEKFTKNNDSIKIGKIGESFMEWFGNKIETPTRINPVILYYGKLSNFLCDSIIVMWIGEEKIETNLQDIYFLMSKQSHGNKGVLITNGKSNVFHVRDKKNIMRTIYLCWYTGWYIDSFPTDNVYWYKDTRIFYKK
ncbi:MAG: hypothetical protein WCS86_02855 [Candidatus Paceibacterota bacterium]